MKKILVFFSIIYCLFLFASEAIHAQEESLLLAVTEYQTREQLDILFANSTRVLDYIEAGKGKQSVFLSLITDVQKQRIVQHGLSPSVIDADPDLSRYVFLFHYQPNQSEKLKSQGEVYEITKNHTLLKLLPDTPLVYEGVIAEFQILPLYETMATPALRTRKTLTATPTVKRTQPTTSVSILPEVRKKQVLPSWLKLVGAFYFLGVFGSAVVLHKKGSLSGKMLAGVILFTIIIIVGLFVLFGRSNMPVDDLKKDLEITEGEEL